MADKKADDSHCPYCKRHCSLDAPHCGKGKAYAKKIKTETDSLKAQKEVRGLSQIGILLYYKLAFDSLYHNKNHGGKGKKNKALVIGALIQADGRTAEELHEDTGIDREKLTECLEKLESKGVIKRQKELQGPDTFLLSEKGKRFLEKLTEDGEETPLSRLTDEERDQLKYLLKKLL